MPRVMVRRRELSLVPRLEMAEEEVMEENIVASIHPGRDDQLRTRALGRV